VSFDAEKLVDNLTAISSEIVRSKPASSKGRFLKGMSLSSAMGPGVKVDLASVETLTSAKS
jgi:large subunit ribosomal protein L1